LGRSGQGVKTANKPGEDSIVRNLKKWRKNNSTKNMWKERKEVDIFYYLGCMVEKMARSKMR
jgi:hypothetical protein